MPFGEEINGLGGRSLTNGYETDSVRQKFTGYERDSESDLDFAEARYLSNRHGRFMSADPLMASASVYDPQSFNRYAYVSNNPLNLTDPTGMMQQGSRNDDCPTGKVCTHDEKGNITSVTDDNDPISIATIISGAVGAVLAPVKETGTYIVEWTIKFPKQVPDPSPIIEGSTSLVPRILGSVGYILFNPTTTGPKSCSEGGPKEECGIFTSDGSAPDVDKTANPNPADNQPNTDVNKSPELADKSQNQRPNTKFKDETDEEIYKNARDRKLPGPLRKEYQTEEKVRGKTRNKQKRDSK